MALVRLQEPSNAECPVIQAYISLLVDTNPMVSDKIDKICFNCNRSISTKVTIIVKKIMGSFGVIKILSEFINIVINLNSLSIC